MTLPPEHELVRIYSPLVRKLAAAMSKRTGFKADADDLYSEGMIGLLKAARAFDPARGIKFITFAHHHMTGAMLDGIRAMDWVPRRCRERSKVGRFARDAYYKVTGERPIEQARRMPRSKKRRVSRSVNPISPVLDQDHLEPIGINGFEAPRRGMPLDNLDNARSSVPNPYVSAEQADAIRSLTRGLSREERFVVLSSCVHGVSLDEVGKAVGICQSMVSRIRTQALASLRGRLSGTMSAMSG